MGLSVPHDIYGFGWNLRRMPVRLWTDVDEEFKDLVVKMADLDPKRWNNGAGRACSG